uniref:J domain-containing protein n=1 Tax=Trichuris muris TaxID=70415 RepID=A0A5S6R0N1_TRIMR
MAGRAFRLLRNVIGYATPLLSSPSPSVVFPSVALLPWSSNSDSKVDHRPHLTCWNCHEIVDCTTDKFFCRSCDFVQPPLTCGDYFGFFDLPKGFSVDVELLRKRFRALQFSLHPDKFTRRSEKERAFSEEQAAKINTAYFTLLKPLPRAVYLLSLHGFSVEEEGNQDFVSPEVLMEMLEANEELDELNPVTGSADEKRLHEMWQHVCNRINACEQQLEEAFAFDDFQKAKALVSELKFCNSLFERIDAKVRT